MPGHPQRRHRSTRCGAEVHPVDPSDSALADPVYDRGEPGTEEAEASVISEYEAKIAALERKVGQLTMELELVKKTPRLRLVSDNENFSIITGPKPAPSDGGAK